MLGKQVKTIVLFRLEEFKMKGINIEDINNMNEEEIDNAIIYFIQIKKDREIIKREEAINKLKKAWDMVVSLGVTIYDNDGNQITKFEDLDYTF